MNNIGQGCRRRLKSPGTSARKENGKVTPIVVGDKGKQNLGTGGGEGEGAVEVQCVGRDRKVPLDAWAQSLESETLDGGQAVTGRSNKEIKRKKYSDVKRRKLWIEGGVGNLCRGGKTDRKTGKGALGDWEAVPKVSYDQEKGNQGGDRFVNAQGTRDDWH